MTISSSTDAKIKILPETLINKIATKGKIRIWLNIPNKKSLGCFITLIKSCVVKLRPRVSIMNAKAIGKILVTISILCHNNLIYTHHINMKFNNKCYQIKK